MLKNAPTQGLGVSSPHIGSPITPQRYSYLLSEWGACGWADKSACWLASRFSSLDGTYTETVYTVLEGGKKKKKKV